MLVHETVTYLEMTSPEELRPGRPPPAPLELRRETEPAAARAVHDAVGAPHQWSSLRWSGERWAAELATPGAQWWVATVGGRPAGILTLRIEADGSHEIVNFGLAPEFVGRGFGGSFLTLAVRLAWDAGARRVWLHTSSLDHPHALANYEARGFRRYRVEHRRRDLATPPP